MYKKGTTITRDAAIQFALNPSGRMDIATSEWNIFSILESVVLFKSALDDGCEYIEDRPTSALLNLFLIDNEKVDWSHNLNSLYAPDTTLTIPQVQKLFNLKRSTIQTWENGVKALNSSLITRKSEDKSYSICKYGDLLPFLKYHFANRAIKHSP